MEILINTHVLLWALTDTARLPKRARGLLENSHENEIFASAASIWEIAIKHGESPGVMLLSSGEVLEMTREANIPILDIKPEHATTLETLRQKADSAHRDPFGRLLIAQAKAEHLRFMTHDKMADEYDEACILKV